MKIQKTLFLLTFLMFFSNSYSQIEYKFYANAFGDYYTGKDLPVEHNNIDYYILNQSIGIGGAVGYNITKNISSNIKYTYFIVDDETGEGPFINLEKQSYSIGLNYKLIPFNKISPYFFADINYNLIELEANGYISTVSGDIIAISGARYNISTNNIGYSFGAGAKIQLHVKWELSAQLGYHINPIINSFSAGIGVQYSFLTKQH